jgi:hypothetical protein
MPTYQVYYARRPTFHSSGELGTPLLTVSRLRASHLHLCEIEAASLDSVFRQMQGEMWSPSGEARRLLEKLGLTHTSMSVGDAIRDEEGIYWECVEWGWRRIEDGTGEATHVLHEEPAQESNP